MIDQTAHPPVTGGASLSLQELGMRLHVPYNNDLGLIEAIIPFAASITSLYLPCNHTVLGSGRYEGRSTNRGMDSYDVSEKKIPIKAQELPYEAELFLPFPISSFRSNFCRMQSTLYKTGIHVKY